LTSQLGKGTTFRILLPCAEIASGATNDATFRSVELADPDQDARLLIVEDEEPLRQAVASALRRTGFEVFEAADGATAIDFLHDKGGEIDIVLLDATIPGPSFDEVIFEAVSARPEVKVVLTSAYSQEMVTPSVRYPQIRAFIRKPFRLKDLLETLSFRTQAAGR
jgi:DNA-binding response OmpR family regulator